MLFSTVYMANLAVITTLASRGEWVLLDRLSHASLLDAALLSGARLKRYPHGNTAAARVALAERSLTTTVVATDGVFSMDGDIAPLADLSRWCREHAAWLVVDDAHGIGVIGKNGRGSAEHYGLDAEQIPVIVGTLGKALGSFGAFVAGSSALIELLIQRARPYIYTTALPQPVAAATRKALEIVQRESWRREWVLALAKRFRSAAEQMGIPVMPAQTPPTPIQPIVLGSPERALSAQQELLAAGFCVVAIRPPTVPRGSARLRVSLSSTHTEAQVDGLVEALGRICRRPAAA
jgi:8-amino-7-oxononanoate synthase